MATGRLEGAHLSDHPAGAQALRDVLKPGSKIGKFMGNGLTSFQLRQSKVKSGARE